MSNVRRLGILTGGGDCPGLNAVIRAVAKTAILKHNIEVVGIEDGFQGLVEQRSRVLSFEDVSGILAVGGTILGASNRADPFMYAVLASDGTVMIKDVSQKVLEYIDRLQLDVLVCVGGEGTHAIAAKLARAGVKIIGVPKTIDNDVVETDITFGFDSARTVACEAIDRLHSTAQSHHRVMIVELMGRNAGWLALEAGVAGGADVILIPEIPYHLPRVIEVLEKRSQKGKRFSIVAIAEGARPKGGSQVYQEEKKDLLFPRRLGGIGQVLARSIEQNSDLETRVTVLGHLQRGGTPTAFDRILGTRYGYAAVECAVDGKFGLMVALRAGEITTVPISEVAGKQRLVPPDCHLIKSARAVGVSFGEGTE